ncbi:hypothetical protein JCM10207_008559 [Rhodosporidiobolus poonsookiae]
MPRFHRSFVLASITAPSDNTVGPTSPPPPSRTSSSSSSSSARGTVALSSPPAPAARASSSSSGATSSSASASSSSSSFASNSTHSTSRTSSSSSSSGSKPPPLPVLPLPSPSPCASTSAAGNDRPPPPSTERTPASTAPTSTSAPTPSYTPSSRHGTDAPAGPQPPVSRTPTYTSPDSDSASILPPPYAALDPLAGPTAPASTPSASKSAPAAPAPPSSSSPFIRPAPADAPSPWLYKVSSSFPPVCMVHPSQLRLHLRLMGAFAALRTQIESPAGDVGLAREVRLPREKRWGAFVAVAVGRFEVFVEALKGRTGATAAALELMPLDVALVLHTYQINPRRFEEDTLRTHPQLALFADVLLTRVAECVSPLSSVYYPPQEEVDAWEELTGLVFDPVESWRTSEGRWVCTPRTRERVFVPYLTADGTGYAQSFRFTAPNGEILTHESLAVARLAMDVATIVVEGRGGGLGEMLRLAMEANPATLAGSVLSTLEPARRTADSKRAVFIRTQVRGDAALKQATCTADVGGLMGWNRRGAERVLVRAVGETKRKAVSQIVACYIHGEPFSLDLQAAVLRQSSFIAKMENLGWLKHGAFPSDDDSTLQRCVARYHGFLMILEKSPATFCVPTLDIDLAWHTHQLTRQYRDHMVFYVGRHVDHDDKVEENFLAGGFEKTAKAWQKRFGVPYSTCGCPVPSAAPSLSLFTKRFSLSSSSSSTSAASAANVPFSAAPQSANATHPSDHNGLAVTGSQDLREARRDREKEWEKVQRRRGGAAALEPVDENALAGVGSEKGVEKMGARGLAHQAAFFAPIPLMLAGGAAVGVAGLAMAGCVPTDVNHSKGTGGGGGGGACGGGGGACASSCAGGNCGSCAGSACSGGGDGGGGCGGGCGGGS